MPFVCPNNVQETTITTGIGPVTLLGAVTDARDFDSQLADGDTTPYTIKMGADEEYGIGTFTAAGLTLTRTTVLGSTNGGALFNFGAGTKNVYAALPGEMVESLLEPDGTTGLVVRTAAQTYARQPVTTPMISPLSWITVTDPTYGATGDGTTDDSTAIQAAIDAAELVPGGKVIFPPGAYNLGTTGITILGDGIILDGVSPRFVGASLFGVEFLYSGTGDAVTFGSSARTAHYRNGFSNIQVRATGSAKTSATAVGIKIVNQHYFRSDEAAAKDFVSGTGLLFAPTGVGGFGALNAFYGFITHVCKTGIKAQDATAPISENVATFYGGTTIGDQSAGSAGLYIGVDNGGFVFYGMDFESSQNGVVIYGGSNRFVGTRSEFNTGPAFDIKAGAVRTHIIAHQFASSSLLSEMIADASSSVYMTNENAFYNIPKFQGLVDKGEVLYVTKADGTTGVFDVSSNGTPRAELLNAADLNMYSDAFTTLVASINGTTGKLTCGDIVGKKVLISGDISELIQATKADGTTVLFDVSGDGTPRVEVVNGANFQVWSDAFTTLVASINGTTGDVKGKTLTASGTAIGVGAGEISLGGNTATTVGAAGGAAALPATPLGFINAYVAGTAVKIPYYNN